MEGIHDKYLTKTNLKTINLSKNKARWKRIVDKDLYSRTDQRGIPKLTHIELKH